MLKFKCPCCNVIDDEFVIHKNEEEKLKDEKNYNNKIEKLKKIVSNLNNKNNSEKSWRISESTTFLHGRTIYNTFIIEHMPPVLDYLYIGSDIITKYDKYNYIECKICGYKQYVS